jgi:hypothetical protein
MRRLLLLFALVLPSCANLTPEQNARLFDAGLAIGERIADKVAK